jgi:hypothetical protein
MKPTLGIGHWYKKEKPRSERLLHGEGGLQGSSRPPSGRGSGDLRSSREPSDSPHQTEGEGAKEGLELGVASSAHLGWRLQAVTLGSRASDGGRPNLDSPRVTGLWA